MRTTIEDSAPGLSGDAERAGVSVAGPQVRTHAPSSRPSGDSAAAVFATLRREKWLVTGITLAMAAASLIAALILPKEYQATTLIAPVSMSESAGEAGGGSLLSRLGGIASFVGATTLSMPEAIDVATLKSDLLTQRYIQENNLLPVLYASKWNSGRNRWRTDDPAKIPTLWDAGRYFASYVRNVTEVKTTGLYRVTITWTNPELAAQWANGIVALTNDYMRKRAMEAADRNVAYLKQQAEKTSDVDIKAAVFQLMQQEIKNAMIAQGQREYALKVIDPAFVPEKPSSPLPGEWLGIGFLAGLFTSLVIVMFKARQTMSDLNLSRGRVLEGVQDNL